MDYPPSYVMRLLQTARADDLRTVLGSRAIWLCLNCENCYQRCPMSVDIPSVMDALRHQALRRGMAHRDARKILAFHRAFLSQIRRNGRLYEAGMEVQYKLATGQVLQDIPLVPPMLAKGKLRLFPERIKDRRAVEKLFAAAEQAAKDGQKNEKEGGR